MKIYLAGPDVFRPDAAAWAEQARALCRAHGFEALTPLDHGETQPGRICEGNLELIRRAQMVVANLNPFRGAEPDSGTAFELGYAHALGKRLWAYIESPETLRERVARLQRGRRRAPDSVPTDQAGWMVEDFGYPVNLMLALSVQLVHGDLAVCLTSMRPRTPTPAV